MGAQHSLTTKLFLTIEDGSEFHLEIKVGFNFTPGYRATRYDPGAGDSIEIDSVRILDAGTEVLDIGAWFTRLVQFDSALACSLIAKALEDRESERDAAAERRADEQRELRILGEA